jgi:hypothetical protein
MGRQLVRLADDSGFTLAGERVNRGMVLELQLEDDLWVPGAIEGWPTLDHAVLFIVPLRVRTSGTACPGPRCACCSTPPRRTSGSQRRAPIDLSEALR